MSQKGWAQMATPSASWIASHRLGHRRRLAHAEGRLALDQIAADEGPDVADLLRLQAGGVGRRREDRLGQVGAADRLVGGDPLLDLGFVELEAGLLQRGGHPQRALLAVGEELGQPLGEPGTGVVDVVAEDVQFQRRGPAVVDGRDLDGRDHPHAQAIARGEGLRDAADGVVVGQREQLHAGLGGAGHHLRGGEGAVGVGGVRLQVEPWRHRRRSLSDGLSGRRAGGARGASRGG